jgi:membrane-associated protease RseP (regulator of RpoE activity)
LIAIVGAAAAVMTGSAANAEGISIRELGKQQLRLATIGYRIAAANAQSCARPEMMSGIIAHDLTQYPAAARPLVSQAFSLNAGFGVLQIVPGSAADRAGLKIDDEILAVGEATVEDQPAVASARQSYSREEQFVGMLSAALAKGHTPLLVRRAGQLLHLTIQGQPGCGGNVILSTSSNLNAWSDGSRVMVTTAMMQQAANDDELAFVIAHEMAHNILGHAHNDSMGLFGMLGFGSARVKRMEVDADSYAVPLMNAAGYSPFGGISFLQETSRRMWWSDLSLDHPSFGRRIKIVTAAIGRLPQANGLRLAQL